MQMRIAILGLALLAGLNRPAAALVVDGRLTSALYNYEALKDSATTTTFLRANQGLRLDLMHLGHKSVSLHTYMQASTDFAEEATNDPRLRLYNAYLAWWYGPTRIHIGRERIISGAGMGRTDGLRVTRRGKGWNLDAYVGALAPMHKGAAIGSWERGNLWGGRVQTTRWWGADLSVSFAHRQRQRVSGVDVVRRVLSLEGRRSFHSRYRLSSRLDYDPKKSELQRAELDARITPVSRLSLTANWLYRQPAVYAGSLFAMFPHEPYQEISSGVVVRATDQLAIAASLAWVVFADDEAQRLGLNLYSGTRFSLGYYRTIGYARASDGLVGSIAYSLGSNLSLDGQLDLTTFERYEEADERDGLAAGRVGLTWRPVPDGFVEAQVQALRNPVYASDLRTLLRMGWHFHQKRGEK